jgi:hypothetical protein
MTVAFAGSRLLTAVVLTLGFAPPPVECAGWCGRMSAAMFTISYSEALLSLF